MGRFIKLVPTDITVQNFEFRPGAKILIILHSLPPLPPPPKTSEPKQKRPISPCRTLNMFPLTFKFLKFLTL